MTIKTKRKLWIKFYPEKWLFGTTREEMTNAERAVWFDFLSLAALNDPPGQFSTMSYKRLANQLNISPKLLNSTIQKAILYGKIDVNETRVGSDLNSKNGKNKPYHTKSDTKKPDLVTTRSKFGITLVTIKILKWNDYQSEYMRQKPYRNKDIEKDDEDRDEKDGDERLQNLSQEVVTQVTDRGEERREEEKRIDKKRGEDIESDSNPLAEFEPDYPIQSKDKPFDEGNKPVQSMFLSRLKGLPGYPFDEGMDNGLFLFVEDMYSGIDIIRELDKKIAWWMDNPDALSEEKGPRQQLAKWFEKEYEFQQKKSERR